MIAEWLAWLWHTVDAEMRDHAWVWHVRGERPDEYLDRECLRCGLIEHDWLDTRLFGGCPGRAREGVRS